MLGDERRRWEYDRFEYAQMNGRRGGIDADAFDAMDAFVSTSPGGHPFVWESSFDSARRGQQQSRYAPSGFGYPHAGAFDPFELFNAMFAREFDEMDASDRSGHAPSLFDEMLGMHGPPGFGAPPRSHAGSSSQAGAFGGMHDPFGGFGAGASPFAMLSGMPPMHTSQAGGSGSRAAGGQSSFSNGVSSFSSLTSFNGAPVSVSESRRTAIVDGRRETIITRRDGSGNETVHRFTPDGETIHVNGQLQSSIGAAPQQQEARMLSDDTSAKETAPPSQRRKRWGYF